MTALREENNIIDSSDSSNSSTELHATASSPPSLCNNNDIFYKTATFVNKLDSYNNNQLLLPTQFYKTLLAKAVLSSSTSSNDDKSNVYKNMLCKKAFGWSDGAQTAGNPGAPQGGAMGSQGAQGLVHWMSVMAEMDPAVSHYMSWNQEQCGQHDKDGYPNWSRNSMGINKQGYEAKMNDHQAQGQKGNFNLWMDEHHMGGTPGIYQSGRSTSSSSSPGVAGSSPALLVVPQPINATKMGGMQNGGPQPRKYNCKMCPQVRCDWGEEF